MLFRSQRGERVGDQPDAAGVAGGDGPPEAIGQGRQFGQICDGKRLIGEQREQMQAQASQVTCSVDFPQVTVTNRRGMPVLALSGRRSKSFGG